jgi:site-specific recombinase XerD
MSEAALAIPPAPDSSLTSLFAATPHAAKRTLEFFATQIHNDHTSRAYLQAMETFSAWCGEKGIGELRQVEPIHVAAYIKEMGQHRAAPTVKQHLAALRMPFDWLVTGQVLPLNPAHAVRGSKYMVKKGSTFLLHVFQKQTRI